MRSFRARLVVAMAAIALLAVALTTWAIAATTESAIEDRLEERDAAEAEIVEELTFLAFEITDWSDAADEVTALATENEARIVLLDLDGRPLVDSGTGPLPNALVGIIDPFGPLAEFGEEFNEAELDLVVSDCLSDQGVEHVVDEFGVYIVDEADAFLLDLCFTKAFEDFGSPVVETVAEPAYLLVDYNVDPPLPWLQLGLVAGVVLVLAAGAALVTSGVIAGPVRSLTEATRAIRGGDLSTRVTGGGSDELGDLADSFNEMADSLEGADRRRKQLTSDVAHELRSPVTNIIGHLDAVEDGVTEPTPEHLAVISAEAQRLHRLIEDLGQLTEADEGEIRLFREEQNVGAIVTRAVEARRMLAEEHEIDLSCDCPTATASVDGARIEQVVGNLLDNAIVAVADGGAVHVDVVADATEIRIVVIDNGPGIPDELLESLFDRLRRGDRARTPGLAGRGLGLAIARALVRAHGGDIAAANDPTGGARFTVTLPI
ncbi:MAG: ATP-binding protein [Acidimicrobiia bacterium]|nr:ATP-binding protein [Acidimicrobiia bacterium]